jgi:hypothetical protein
VVFGEVLVILFLRLTWAIYAFFSKCHDLNDHYSYVVMVICVFVTACLFLFFRQTVSINKKLRGNCTMKIVELKLICVVKEGSEQDHINTLTIGGVNPVNILSVDANRKIVLDVIDYEIEEVSDEAC